MDNPAALLDHTLLTPVATTAQIMALCEEAVEYGFAAVCIPPCHVPAAADRLYGSDVKIATVVGFPCGYNSLRQKVQETADLIGVGATEIDMVISLGRVLENRIDLVEEEILQIVAAARHVPVKVIIECCFLTDQQKIALTEIIVRAKASFVKTSTGFGPFGATVEDVRLLATAAKGRVGVKGAGGIRTLEDCCRFVEAGATRIGTSSAVQIMHQWQRLNRP